ncbi:MAG: hypothetical protein CVT48_00905 [Thermoplasmata archaeon HGW-Thermoplasmata-1]|nr:MAG: hypothetical protein CVT48_00905 [Thermoplasmata archaeon HGW-Thermoplasmata-1]
MPNIITLLGECQAKKGGRFVYLGHTQTCKECKLRTICFNLEAGKMYEVAAIREKLHDCLLHDTGARVVEVTEVTAHEAAIPEKSANGTAITLNPEDCKNRGCGNWRLCHPDALAAGKTYKIIKIERKKVECPEGHKLKAAILEE